MRILLIGAIVIVGLSFWSTVIAQEISEVASPLSVHLTTSKENVVASELMGEWIADSDIGTRLGGRSDHLGNGPITFRVNKESEQRIITFLSEILTKALENEQDAERRSSLVAMQTLYLIGEVEFEGNKQDFALTSVFGTPRILLYDREGDLESERNVGQRHPRRQ